MRKSCYNQICNIPVKLVGYSKITLDGIFHISNKPDHHRLVQSHLSFHSFNQFRLDVFSHHQRYRVSRHNVQHKKYYQHNTDKNRDSNQYSFNDKFYRAHVANLPSLLTYQKGLLHQTLSTTP